MKNTSKKFGEDQPEAAERWEVPKLGGQDGSSSVGLGIEHITVEKIERIRRQAYKQAYDEGYAKGFSHGEADGLKSMQPHIEMVQKLSQQLATPFDGMDTEIENQLAQLAVLIAKQIIRREIENDPGQIVATVREAISLLPLNSNTLYVHVHPDDYEVLKDIVHLTNKKTRLHIEQNVALQRGDCKVFTEYSSIDASLETRITALVTEMLGGNRSGDPRDVEAAGAPDGIETRHVATKRNST